MIIGNSSNVIYKNIITEGALSQPSVKQIIEYEIQRWKASPVRKMMIDGYLYYRNFQDILDVKRLVIGADGTLQEVTNLPNNRLIDNQYAKMVDQKANYSFGKPFTVDTENAQYADALNKIFNHSFNRKLKRLGKEAMEGAVAWLYVYYDNEGQLSFSVFSPFEGLPFWADAEHTKLDMYVRLYEVAAYQNGTETVIEKVEIYTINGIERYILRNTHLIPDENPVSNYYSVDGEE